MARESELINAAGPVEHELFCAGCGYSLKGLDAAGKCPECAQPVLGSVPVAPLAKAEPRYLNSIHMGLVLILVSLGLQLLLAPFGSMLIAGLLTPSPQGLAAAPTVELALLLAIGSPWIVCRLMSAAGWWLCTAKDASESESDPRRLRLLLRAVVILMAVTLFAVAIARATLFVHQGPPWNALKWVWIAANAADLALTGIWFFLAMALLARLSHDASCFHALKRLRWIKRLVPFFWPPLAILIVVPELLGSIGGVIGPYLLAVIGSGALVTVGLYGGVVDSLRKSVKRIREAQQAAARAATA